MIIRVPAILGELEDGIRIKYPKYLNNTKIQADMYGEHPIGFEYYTLKILSDPENEIPSLLQNEDVEVIEE